MFELNGKHEIDRRILECDCILYSPAAVSTINTPNSQIYINISREGSVNSLIKSHLDLNFEVIRKADNNIYGDGNDKRQINLGPTVFITILKLTTSSGNLSEYISHTHIVSLTYKLVTSAKVSDDLSIGFDRDRNRRPDELTRNKIIKGKYHVEIMLKDVLGFAEHQEKAIYGAG